MVRLIISENPLEQSDYRIVDVPEDVKLVDAIVKEFPTWPDSACIYHKYVSQTTDVTPYDDGSIEALNELDGEVYIVVYPEGVIVTLILIVVAVVALAVVASLIAPEVPEVATPENATTARNQQTSSPNNELAQRTNKPRLTARIPDIYGQVRSTPDLINETYEYYEANRKVEVSYMCVGRGEYTIHDVRDGDTPLSRIAGSSAEFYGPGKSPNSGDAAFFAEGSAINEPLYRTRKLDQIVGQEMRPPNSASITGSGSLKYEWPDRIYTSDGTNIGDRFVADDVVTVSGASKTVTSDDINVNENARYVHNGGTPYVEWQGGDPSAIFENGDTLVISGSNTNGAVKPFTESWTGSVTFNATDGRLEFSNNADPVDAGDDFRAGVNIVITNASYTKDLRGTFDITGKTSTILTVDTADGDVPADWDKINTVTEYKSVTVGGISRTVRFYPNGDIELQSGNWDDIDYPATVTTVIVGSEGTFTTSLNGTYNLSTYHDGQDYFELDSGSPENTNAEWDEIDGSETITGVTLEQTHSNDTTAVDFNGSYTISSRTADRIYLTNPGSVNSDWNLLSGFVNERTEYPGNTDNFFVNNPQRTINLNGTYTILSTGTYEMFLSDPASVAPDWDQLEFVSGDEIQPNSSSVVSSGSIYIGEFFMDEPDMTRFYANFIAQNGLYKDDGEDQHRASVTIEIGVRQADADGTYASGSTWFTRNITLLGSAVNKDTVAESLNFALPVGHYGRNIIRARRTTAKDTAFDGTVVDTVKFEEVWMLTPETRNDFGNITTVHTKTRATGGALAVKERKLNCLVTRKIPYITGFTGTAPDFTPVYHADLIATKDAAQIFCALSLDPHFGNRSSDEIDFYGIFQARDQISAYFNSTDATEFCYTFDNVSVSYEEAASSVASACFCTAYRQGNLLKWKPETAQADPVLLFNHRNKIPDTETRSIRFGAQNEHDGIVLTWADPDNNDSIEQFYIPEDQSAVAPKKIETIGVRNISQATWHAWRSYYKTLYQNTAVEFESTQEAALLVRNDRVLVADNTRADVMDGEIWDQDVLQLTLSQQVNLVDGINYTMFVQHTDGTTEAIPITPVPNAFTDVVRNVQFIPAEAAIYFVDDHSYAEDFKTGEQFTMHTTSYNDPVNGNLNIDGVYTIVSVDAINGKIILENPGLVAIDWTNFTEPNPQRNGVNFTAEWNSEFVVNLQYAPRAPLNLDPATYARATYMIRGDNEVAPQQFMVQETRPRDNFTYLVDLVRFDARFYYIDDLQFWLNFDDQTYKDASAQAHNVTVDTFNQAPISWNATRGSYVFDNTANASSARVESTNLTGTTGDYTKAVWVNHTSGFDAYFLSNNNEQFRVNGNNRLIVGHDSGNLTDLTTQTWPDSGTGWHHACVTYDASEQLIKAFVNGVLVAQKTNLAPPTAAAILQPIGLGSSGVIQDYCDDVRYWKRAFSDQEVADLYNATR